MTEETSGEEKDEAGASGQAGVKKPELRRGHFLENNAASAQGVFCG